VKSLIVSLVVLSIACGKTKPMVPPPQPAAMQPSPRVIFPDGFVIAAEIAADDDTRERGLMFRDQLQPGTGMLFLFPSDGRYPFWMKNTLIPLDMIWLDSGGRVVFIGSDVPPCKVQNCPSVDPGADSRYVLEVAGGVARQHGLKQGDMLRMENLQNIHPE
jgi:uncharacterized membrane protein (UPF0127 family)